MTTWLVIGHGSVGSSLVRRIRRTGAPVTVFDPAPRLPVVDADHLTRAEPGGEPFDVAISCVVPSAAFGALEAVQPILSSRSLYLDWNTLPPHTKRDIAARALSRVVDVALMDTLDSEREHPTLAVGGDDADEAAALLTGLGFAVAIAGRNCGDAAQLKLARSLFMKSLEALVLEFEAAISPLPGRDVVIVSIEQNLGKSFSAFARMLIETDRVHADRRGSELESAVAAYRDSTRSLRVATASIGTLRAAAAAWQLPDAPATTASSRELSAYLARSIEVD